MTEGLGSDRLDLLKCSCWRWSSSWMLMPGSSCAEQGVASTTSSAPIPVKLFVHPRVTALTSSACSRRQIPQYSLIGSW